LHALTGLRGLAAWLVVLYHIRLSMETLLPASAIAILGKGYLAVDLFFMLSGFVLWLNYGARLASGGWGESRRFWWRRVARIWPLHAAILAALLLFALLLLATGRPLDGYPLAEWPLHLLLVQNWGLTPDLSWNHPAWSISAEMAAYLLFPLLAIALPWQRLSPVALGAMLVALALALHTLFALRGASSLGHDIPRLGLWRCLAEFAMGVVLANLWFRWRESGAMARLCAIAAVLAAGCALLTGLPETAFAPSLFAGLLLTLALGRGATSRLLASKPLRRLGEWSYATYLAHYPLFIAFKLVFVGEDLQLGWATTALFLALVLASSALLHRLLERPAQAWLSAHPPRLKARKRAAAPT